jgi:ABC-type transport system involved in cytochrome c biogenesis permease subunit
MAVSLQSIKICEKNFLKAMFVRYSFFMHRFLLLFLLGSSLVHATLTSLPNSLETLTIQESGRRKPYFVFAEETLRFLSGKTALIFKGRKEEASEIITSFWLEPDKKYAQEPLIFISFAPLKKILGLPLEQSLFSYEKLIQHSGLQEMIAQAMEERKNDPRKRLQGTLKEASDVGMRLSLFEELRKGSIFRIVPNAQVIGGRWGTLSEWEESDSSSNVAMAQNAFSLMQQGWKSANSVILNQGVLQLREALSLFSRTDALPSWKLQLEVFLQKIHPFRWAWILYALAGLLILLFQKKSFYYRLGWFFAGTGFFIQCMGLLARVLIAGRPPVTNMYESIIWVAFGTVLFALCFEMIYHAGVFLLGAIPVALVSLILADSQPLILDPSIHPLTPVLRDNFWLTIHVLTITLSYAAFALSLGVAHGALIRIILNKKVAASLYNYLYRTLQVGILLLATGTILGGVWANYSWGRFWDWDPKETWALIALLGYLFLLHGRLAGRWGGFGLAVGSVVAFLSVLMAWYGVNFVLGAGLHSYGFGAGGFPMVLGFVGLEVAVLFTAFIAHYKK